MENIASVTSGAGSLKFIVNLHGPKLILITYFCINISNKTINKVRRKQKYVIIQYVNRPS
jgi:hypothetical protein